MQTRETVRARDLLARGCRNGARWSGCGGFSSSLSLSRKVEKEDEVEVDEEDEDMVSWRDCERQ
jgi:hypothetical protein